MPEFILDIAGTIRDVRAPSIEAVKRVDLDFADLDAFTQGYVEALFFTSTGTGDDGDLENAGFGDLAPETIASIIADCAAFQSTAAESLACAEAATDGLNGWHCDAEHAGRDFWYTRAGHGCGFWDGGWPDPYAAELTDQSKQFRSADLYRGDDGKFYLA